VVQSSISVGTELSQATVVNTEMVCYLVPYDPSDNGPYLFHCTAPHLDWAAVYGDLIRQHETITMIPSGLWHTVIEAQKLHRMAQASSSQRTWIWPVFNDHIDVVQSFLNLAWKVV
jgi:hypothetical protein